MIGRPGGGARPPLVHRGGCHCGAVQFEVRAPAVIEALECNCSICTMTGFLHLIVARERFTLLQGADALVEYRFNTGTARHLFCRSCGVKSFYVPRSHPEGYSVNVRCLAPGTIERVDIELFDDGDRESAEARVRGLTDPD
jgi:hypothetical protein